MIKNDATYLSTLSQLSAIQKYLTSKKKILNSSVSSQKKLLLWGLHYIILCERNNASEKLSTAITKTTKYYYVCYHDKKYKR